MADKPSINKTHNQKPLTYADAGVNIDAGNALVHHIAPLAKATKRRGADGDLGGFGGVFDLKACGFNDPLLVAANDGVGTKLKLAIETGLHDTIGIDLVAMCVNDLIVQGAEPLLFLDYYATAALDVEHARRIIAGIAEGCKQAGCALIGGETAEMPGLYANHDYDLAGFALGAVERENLLPRPDIKPGDIILGLASDGLHANGYSLVRHLIAEHAIDLHVTAPFADTPLAMALMRPTRIYVSSIHAVLAYGVKALAHITGGGLIENIPRILPDACAAHVRLDSWTIPPLFHWLQELGNIDLYELIRTFNCGIGMVLIADATDKAALTKRLVAQGETVFEIGQIKARENGAAIDFIS